MKVLHVIWSLDPALGGAQVAAFGLAQGQRAAGYQSEIFTTTQGNEPSPALIQEQTGVPVIWLDSAKSSWRWHPELSRRLELAIKDSDFVHIHGAWEGPQWFAARIAKRWAKPYVITPCGMLTTWSLAQKSLKKTAYFELMLKGRLNGAAAVHCSSKNEAQMMEPLGLKSKIIIQPNGLEVEEFRHLPPRGSFRNRHPEIPSAQKLVVYLGRVQSTKGIDLLIDAIKLLGRADVDLVVAGPDVGGETQKLKNHAETLGLGKRVHFVGMMKGRDRLTALVDADVFASASHHENFGLTVIEALASGLPVILSDKIALHEQIRRAAVGSIEPLIASNFAAAIGRWLAESTRAEMTAAVCRDFAFKTFDWKEIATRWKAEYRALG